MKIVQVLDYFADGNGVANCAVMYYRMTLKLGVESVVVARLIEQKKPYVKTIDYLDELNENDIVMYHMCIGTPLNRIICSYTFQKVLVYQNITPPSMMERYDVAVALACRDGLEQLAAMRNSFSICLVMSEFNKQDLIRYGYKKECITVIPPYIAKDDYSKPPDKKTIQKYSDGWVNIIFVGRISPNKKQEDLIRIFSYYKTHCNPKSRLVLAGGGEGKYYDQLLQYVKKIGIRDVVFTNQISFAELMAVYRTASIFLCASEHEGYCIPLIEAMHFQIPVIAYDACAVRDTMGGAGILLKEKDPILVAKIIHTVCSDQILRARIVKQQTEYIQSLSEEQVFAKYKKWVKGVCRRLKEEPANVCIKNKFHHPYNVVMAIKAADWKIAKRNLEYIRKYLEPKQIVIISSAKMRELIEPEDEVVFLDEDKLCQGLSFDSIRTFFAGKQMGLSLTGWYLQQFLKLAYAFVCRDEYYLVWDADTVPLHKISMIEQKTGTPYFDMKPEYIREYFNTIYDLTGMKKVEPESFIAEHMLFCTRIVRQMIMYIEQNPFVYGRKFFEKILNAADYSSNVFAFSEFELYGTFCQYVYPGMYKKRHLRSMRCGKMFLGDAPRREVLEWAARKKDVISFEYPQMVIERSKRLSESKKFRERYSVNDLMKRIYVLDCLTFPEWLQQEKDALRMDYLWVKDAAYLSSDDFYRLQKTAKTGERFVLFGESEQAYLLGTFFAWNGFQVLLVDQNFHSDKIKNMRKYWGFQAIFQCMYGKNLKIVSKLAEATTYPYAFFFSKNFAQYEMNQEFVKDAERVLIMEGKKAVCEEKLLSKSEHMVWMHLSLRKKDILLLGKQSLQAEIWEKNGSRQYTVTRFLKKQMQVKEFTDAEQFLLHTKNIEQYEEELAMLKEKYGIKS